MSPIRFDARSDGRLERFPDFRSTYAPTRHIDVWLPPGYDASGAKRYPVLFMHDGQNLFDPADTRIGVDWDIDQAVTRLMAEGVTEGAIVVGLWNTAERRREYMPEQPLQTPGARMVAAEFRQEHAGPPISDAYLRMLVEEVRPLVDDYYRTLTDRDHTLIMGSSMGGLVSLYAICEYPDIFGRAGCVSTHWSIGGSILVQGMAAMLPAPRVHRIYFDYGTETLDALYEPFQLEMDQRMVDAGYQRGQDWVTLKFEGAEHSERAWRERADIPLRFLLEGL
jgi:predicted alpha/beta superfamily hydrolase